MKIRTLIRQARVAATMREHKMKKAKIEKRNIRMIGDYMAESTCKVCGMGFTCIETPLPNEITIAGPAIALSCSKIQKGSE